jgi:hypothetical protein
MPDSSSSAAARKKLAAKAKKKETSVSDLLSQIEQSRARANMRVVKNQPEAPGMSQLPTIKEARKVGSPVDSLLVEEIRRREKFGTPPGMPRGVKKKPRFER